MHPHHCPISHLLTCKFLLNPSLWYHTYLRIRTNDEMWVNKKLFKSFYKINVCWGAGGRPAVLSVLPIALCWASSDEDIVLSNYIHTADTMDIEVGWLH